ncbi:SDR family oxidoreductase [Sphingobacterium sp. Mn56C]|uniref:SDR family oxidoreductase n=1 Tax=Sphingobacterium sp. Mn56C TaxID=3395261 RepID=UPI003BE675FE
MNSTILITGASSGIGKATALYFAARGWQVIASMRDTTDAKAWGDRENIFLQQLDVCDAHSIEKGIAAGIAKFGKIDVLVNNAGYAQYGIFESIHEDQMRKQFEVNVFGVMRTTKAILPHFREQQNGILVNISSGTGRFTVPLMSLYSATKFAIEGFSESLAYELKAQNIRVKIIEPGSTASNFHHTLTAEAAENSTLPDYEAYRSTLEKRMSEIREKYATQASTPAAIAQTIFEAVTDGSDRLRYVAGDDILPFIALRTSSSEQEYQETMQKQFSVD